MPKQTFINLDGDKQKRILDSAIDEFADKGYKAASISRIVAAAGIAKGSFYQYFEDKEDLYGYVIDCAIVRRKLQISDEEGAKLGERSFTQFIRELFNATLEAFCDCPKLLKISAEFAANRSDPIYMRIQKKYKSLNDNYFQKFIRRQKGLGRIDEGVDENVLGFMLLGVNGMISNHVEEFGYGSITREYIEDISDKICFILTNGIYGN